MKGGGHTYNHYKEALSQAIKQKTRLVLSFGPSDYLRIKTEEKFIKENKGACVRLSAERLNLESLYDTLFQSSIFEPSSLYIIKNIEKKNDFARTLSALDLNTSLQNTVLLQSSYRTVPKALDKEIKRLGGILLPCYRPNTYESKGFIFALGRRYQLQLADSAYELLSQSVGDDLFVLENEIRKLSLIFAASEKKNITADDIALYIDYLKEENAFKIDQFIMEKKLGHAQALLHDLLKRGQSPLALLGILSNHCRKALQIYSLLQKNQGAGDIIKVVRMPMFALKNFMQYVRKSPVQKFKTALLECNEADIIFKTSKIDQDLVLNRILVTLTNQ